MTDPISDKDFLKLKNAYYLDGHNGSLPQVTTGSGKEVPGRANNREQNALRWGYDRAMKDLEQQIFTTLFGRRSNE